MDSQFYPGQRLSYSSQLCTERYYGAVDGTSGLWLGVEWDDPSRGKHSGEHQGTRYFTCVNPSPTSASFIRPARKPDEHRSFVDALKFKYASDPAADDDIEEEDPDVQVVFNVQPSGVQNERAMRTVRGNTTVKTNRPIKFSGKVAEEVGFDKIRKQLAQLEELKIIILDGLCVCRPEARGGKWVESGQMTDVKEACPKVVELDLSRNLWEEWTEVAAICEQLDRLRSLRVE